MTPKQQFIAKVGATAAALAASLVMVFEGYAQTEPRILESLLVYLAWDQDYDFKIMPKTPLPALLDLQREAEQLIQQKGKLVHKSLAKKVRTYLSSLLKAR